MGREVRMVPADWVHPRKNTGLFIPLKGGSYGKDAAEWDFARAQWQAGLQEVWHYDRPSEWKPKEDSALECVTYTEWAGDRPSPDDYMPDWSPEQRTHFMMYEDTSEGTPLSPAFATAEELARWLADNGASSFGDMTASYEQWLSTIKRGSAISMVMDGNGIRSGVEAMAAPQAQP
jgi:hypothetical protein